MDFYALDVETANADQSSICQIGIVRFQDGNNVANWQTFLDPEDYFDPFNIEIHGINEEMVALAPLFPEIYIQLKDMLEGHIVVSHMPFDRVAFTRISEKYGLELIQCRWLDSAKIARRAWTKFAHSGYGLANLASEFGISFRHHEAVEDARVAGELVNKAINDTGIPLENWFDRVEKPIFPKNNKNYKIAKEGNQQGPLFGEEIVFTGALSIPRRQAAEMASQIGCNVGPNVTQSTTILVLGEQDVRRLAGQEKSSKHRKVEELIRKGQKIRIIGEQDFVGLIDSNL